MPKQLRIARVSVTVQAAQIVVEIDRLRLIPSCLDRD